MNKHSDRTEPFVGHTNIYFCVVFESATRSTGVDYAKRIVVVVSIIMVIRIAT